MFRSMLLNRKIIKTIKSIEKKLYNNPIPIGIGYVFCVCGISIYTMNNIGKIKNNGEYYESIVFIA